ncbi:MAG: ftsQ [Ilumatobacteraceae bacterium]|nr:ftsQ [Ilumatobacteraceae bacterium]
MTGRDPLPDQQVPDVVLEELLAAFGDHSLETTDGVTYDFDDPSIDRLLGIDTVELRSRAAQEPNPVADAAAPDPAAPDPAAPVAAAPAPIVDREPSGTTDLGAVKPVRVRTPEEQAEEAARQPARARARAKNDSTVALDAAAGPADGRRPSRKERKAGAAALPAAPDPVVAEGPVAAGPRVIVIADDDQHIDPIYLDEDAEHRMRQIHAPSGDGSGGRSTIVIDEFDQHTDAVQALASSSAGIDPRLRARRIAVRRAVGRRRLVWAGIVGGIVVIAVAVVAVFASSLFDVSNIRTQGNVYTDPALVQAVEQQMRGKPTLLVDTKKIERELEASPWIEAARVSTNFPHDALIDIRERIPQATFAGSDGRYRVIDRDGRVLAVLDGRPIAYMLLTGTAPDSEPGQFAGTAYAAAAQLVIALPPAIRSITTSVGVDTTTNELSLEIDAPSASGVQVRLGTVAGIEDKLARLLKFVQDGLQPDQQLDVSTAEVGT